MAKTGEVRRRGRFGGSELHAEICPLERTGRNPNGVDSAYLFQERMSSRSEAP